MQPRHNLPLEPLTTFGVAGTAATAWTLEQLDQVDPLLDAARPVPSASAARRCRSCSAAAATSCSRATCTSRWSWCGCAAAACSTTTARACCSKSAPAKSGTRPCATPSPGTGSASRTCRSSPAWSAAPPGRTSAPTASKSPRSSSRSTRSTSAAASGAAFDRAACAFDYRSSFFKTAAGRRWLITSVRLRLSRLPRPRTRLRRDPRRTRRPGAARCRGQGRSLPAVGPRPTPQQVAQAVRAIRRRKLPDPLGHRQCRQLLQEPDRDRRHAPNRLRLSFANLPVHPVAGDPTRAKLLGRLADRGRGMEGLSRRRRRRVRPRTRWCWSTTAPRPGSNCSPSRGGSSSRCTSSSASRWSPSRSSWLDRSAASGWCIPTGRCRHRHQHLARPAGVRRSADPAARVAAAAARAGAALVQRRDAGGAGRRDRAPAIQARRVHVQAALLARYDAIVHCRRRSRSTAACRAAIPTTASSSILPSGAAPTGCCPATGRCSRRARWPGSASKSGSGRSPTSIIGSTRTSTGHRHEPDQAPARASGVSSSRRPATAFPRRTCRRRKSASATCR